MAMNIMGKGTTQITKIILAVAIGVCLFKSTPCQLAHAQDAPLIVDNYNDFNVNANTMGFWTGGSATISDTTENSFNGTRCRKFRYQNNNWYASNVWDDRTYTDITDYKYLSFAVSGNVTMTLELQYGTNRKATFSFSNSQTAWQEVEVPLSSFMGLNKTQMRSVSMVFQGSGTFYFDNLSFTKGAVEPPPPPPKEKEESTGPVVISKTDNKLYVDGEPFPVKGVGYQPTPVGRTPPPSDDSRFYDRDFPLIADAGFNTIRSWGLPGRNILTKAEQYDLKVIAGFWINKVDFTQASQQNSIEQNFRNFVNAYKYEDSILMWALGNEISLSFDEIAATYGRSKTDIANEFYKLCNRLAEVAYEIEGDSYRPVMIVNGGLLYLGESEFGGHDEQLPFIDVWGVNAYYRDFHNIDFFGQRGSFFNFYKQRSDKPLVLTEYGADAYRTGSGRDPSGEDEEAQAQWVVANTQQILAASDICLGGTIIEYSDEWWKDSAGSAWDHDTGPEADWGVNLPDGYANEEYWGIVRIADDGRDYLEHPWNTAGDGLDEIDPRKAYYDLKELFVGVADEPELTPINETWTVEEGELLEFIAAAKHPKGLPLEFSIDTSGLFVRQVGYISSAVIITQRARFTYIGRFSWKPRLGAAGTYSPVRIVVTDTSGKTASQDITIIVTEEQPDVGIANFATDPNTTNVRIGGAPLTVKFVDLSTGTIEERLWDFGDGTTDTRENPAHTYTEPGDYTVRLTVTTPVNENTETKVDYISVMPPAPVAAFTIDPDPPKGTAPLTVRFVSNAEHAEDHLWLFGVDMTTISREKDTEFTYREPGTYTVIYAVRNPGGGDFIIKEDYVIVSKPQIQDPPKASFTAEPRSGPAPLTVQFTDTSANTAASRQWYFVEGQDVITNTEPTLTRTYDRPGLYTVALISRNQAGWDSMVQEDYITVTGPPVAEFAAEPRSGEAPLTVTFTDRSTGIITAKTIDFGDESGYGVVINTGYGETFTHTYNDPGTYTVSLTAVGPGGSDTEIKTGLITVNAPPSPPPVAEFGVADGYQRTGEVPHTVQFEDASIGDIVEWHWGFGDGGTDTGPSPDPHKYEKAGRYFITLVVKDSLDRWVAEVKPDYITVTAPIPDPPVAAFTASPVTGNAPLTVNFTDYSVGSITNKMIYFDDESGYGVVINTGYGETITHTYNDPGTYTVSLTATGPGGSDIEVKTGLITVEGDPLDADFGISPRSSATGQAPHTVTFLDQSVGDIVVWYWYFGDAGLNNERNPTHTYNTPGTYTVTLAVQNADGDIDVEEKRYFINVTSPPPVAEFEAMPTDGDAPLAVDFTSTSSGTIYTWEWDFGDGQTGYGEVTSHTYYEPRDYTVTLTISGPGGSDIETKTSYISVYSNYKDFDALKDDIENAYSGEEIELEPGIYEFTSDLEIKKDILLTSTDPKRTVFNLEDYRILVKDPDVESGYGEFGKASDVVLRGITIKGRKVEKAWVNTGYGIVECAKDDSIDDGPLQNHAAKLTLEDCRIIDNEGVRVSAIYSAPYSELHLKNVLIANNTNIPGRTTASYVTDYQEICYCGTLFLDKYLELNVERSTIADNIDTSLPEVENATGYGQSMVSVEYGAIHRNNTGIDDSYDRDHVSMAYSIMWNNGREERLKDFSHRTDGFLYRDLSHSDIQQTEVTGSGVFEYIIHVDPLFDSGYEQNNPRHCSGMGIDF